MDNTPLHFHTVCHVGDIPDGEALPVVIGELGNGGEKAGKGIIAIRKAQASAAAHSEFKGRVVFVKTTAFARPAEDSPNTGHGHHWFGNAESYFLMYLVTGFRRVRGADCLWGLPRPS